MIRYVQACAAAAARSASFWLAVLATSSLAGLPIARADITPYGDVSPADPATWDSSTTAYVGDTSAGTLTVDGGSSLSSNNSVIGNGSTATGVVNISGTGSIWTVNGGFYSGLCVGNSGGGALSISNGGNVTVNGLSDDYVGYEPGSTGSVTVDGHGSIWTGMMYLWVGEGGSGKLSITRGGYVCNGATYIGANDGSTGTIVVDGVGSALSTGATTIQHTGALSIINGGSVHQPWGAYVDGGATVDGPGSKWTAGDMFVRDLPSIPFLIRNGGTVTATSLSLEQEALLTIDIGRGSLLSIDGGTGTINNGGTLRMVAGAGVPANVSYLPVSAGTWGSFYDSTSGTYQAIGGTLSASHRFIASSVANGTTTVPLSLNLRLVQRAFVTDNGPGGTGCGVGASFPAAGTTTNITFTATPMSQTVLDVLRGELPTGESVLSGWSFSTTGFTATSDNPVYLSFQVGPGETSANLNVWHYDGSAWTEYSALDLTYDGNYASFTANGLSGYAMVAVPEPGMLVLLAAGCLGLLAYAWRRRK